MSATRVSGLGPARARWGARADEVAASFCVGDPLADAAVAAMAGDLGQARRWLHVGLDGGAMPGPPALVELLEDAQRVLPWQDTRRCDRGAQVLRRNLTAAALVLRCYGLPLAYASPVGNKPLVATGRLVHDTQRRLRETARFVWGTQAPGAMRIGGAGWRACVHVRLAHASVRAGLRRRGWSRDWGAPLPQPDLAATGLLFGVKAVEGMRAMGIAISQDDADDVAHLYRVVSARVGVQPELLVDGHEEGRGLFALLTALHGAPDEDSVRLTDALMHCALLDAPGVLARASGRAVRWWMRGVSGGLLGNEADALGLPASRARMRITAGILRGLQRWPGRRPTPLDRLTLRMSLRPER